MPHAKLENDVPVTPYPYTLQNLYADHPGRMFPRDVWPADMAEYGVVEVLETTPPAITATQALVEEMPAFSNGAWRQVWTVRTLTAGEQTDNRIIENARLIEVAARADALIATFKDMTPAQLNTYVNNQNTVAKLQEVIKKILMIIRPML